MEESPKESEGYLLEPELGWEAAANFRRQQYAALFLETLNDYFAGKDISDEKIDGLMDAVSRHGTTEAGALVWEAVQPKLSSTNIANTIEVRQYLVDFFGRAPVKMRSIGSLDEEMVRELQLTSAGYIDEIHSMLDQIPEDSRELSVFDLPKLRTKEIDEEKRAYKKLVTSLIFELHGLSLPVQKTDDETTWSEVYKVLERISQEIYRDYLKQLRDKKKNSDEKVSLENLVEVLDTLDEHRENQIAAAMIAVDSTPQELQRFLENYPLPIRKRIEDYVRGIKEQPEEDIDEKHE